MSAFQEALWDAESGCFEKLAAFGIEVTRTGDLLRVDYDGTSQLVLNTPQALATACRFTLQELTYRDYCQR